LGFALAVWLSREVMPKSKRQAIPTLATCDPREIMEQLTPLPPTEDSRCQPIPDEWLAMLAVPAKHNPLLAAASSVFKLNFPEYRDQLVVLEGAVRRHRQGVGDRRIGEIVDEIKEANARWFDEMSSAMKALHDTSEHATDLGQLRVDLEMMLEEQAARFETATATLAAMDLAADVSDGCCQLLGEIGLLLAMVHRVRDVIHESLAKVFVHEKCLDAIQQRLLVDPLTGLYCRSGLEAVTWEWWRDDPTRQRLASIAMLDIDRFAEINEQFGAVASDQILFAVAQLLRNTIRDQRGYDVATRCGGQRFVLFFGDTGSRNAVTAAERIRRIVEESRLRLGGAEIQLTVSAGVTPILPSDTTTTLLARAAGALDEAKRIGRNATRVDEGHGPCEMAPPELKISGRTVVLEV
jgi:diguanylate cyclase (GGDEF)-like protein